jgi:serine O-acetyltransferase
MRIESVRHLRDWIAADVARYDLGSGRRALTGFAKTPQLRWQVHLRMTEYVVNQRAAGWRALGAILRWRLQSRAIRLGYTIPVNVCGPGLKLPHWGTVVISAAARVGARATIHPGTVLGVHRGGAPRLGDDVYMAPGAKAYGPIAIGDGAALGANCVVNRSVESGTTVVGAPARPVAIRA